MTATRAKDALFRFAIRGFNFATRKLIWFVCLFLLLYVPSQQLWSLRDGQFT